MATNNEVIEAIYAEIERQAKALSGKTSLNASSQASALKDLAVAYRLTAGGPQPGGSVVNG
ncbi:hypothetical protein QI633_08120 [Nocardioides sp. QY071]|uniref:hypothetical protein n=1 Tax=Nocardioides sp. QY071 TaxID=3044187 RepID=UPI00249A1E15|nr:hypothetical protein [Nocardioides sp. QY071]WGY03718.1 hypothetical protein QI633_08120 [Nocardioides sp. QY071]